MVEYERSMEETPTWAITVVCVVLLVISIFIEHIIHHIEKSRIEGQISDVCTGSSTHTSPLKNKSKRALYEAVEKVKTELMLLGFLSLLLAVFKEEISFCVHKRTVDSWHPCAKYKPKDDGTIDKCTKNEGEVAFISSYAINQLHKFIFVLAVFHVLYCIITLFLGRTKMKKWQVWEDETKTIEYQYSHDPDRFRFARDTSFGRRHLNFWSQSPALLWIACFFRQFFRSIDKVDYLTLRHGFITAHLAPGSETEFDFLKYIRRTLEEDFTVVVGISPIIWFFAVLFLLSNTYGWYAYIWLPFIPLIVILLVGAKLQVIITKMGLSIQDRGDVVSGVPVVQPGDDLFWFNRPGFMLFLINLVLFQNAFQLAFFAFTTWQFDLTRCFHKPIADIVIRLTLGVIIQFLCSYVTLPLYALVTQMGSNMKPTIFDDRVADALRSWHHTARKQIKHNRSENVTPQSSCPGTPTRGTSPVHLLHNYRNSDSYQTSPRAFNFDAADNWDAEGSTTQFNIDSIDSDQPINAIELSSTQLPPGPRAIRTQSQHEISIDSAEFSFNKRRNS